MWLKAILFPRLDPPGITRHQSNRQHPTWAVGLFYNEIEYLLSFWLRITNSERTKVLNVGSLKSMKGFLLSLRMENHVENSSLGGSF